jgi:hypothetical protein
MSENTTPTLIEKIKRRKKLIIGIVIALLIAPFGRLRLSDGVTTLVESSFGNLILLILLGTGIVKIARKNPTGWLWGSSFFLYSGFGHFGITSWVYLIIAGLGIWTYLNWTTPKNELR